jgi:alkylation response protein AidB-like acyl-CoA dehydrogenase
VAADRHLQLAAHLHAPPARVDSMLEEAGKLGRRIGSELGPLVAGYQTNLPRLEKFDGAGNAIEQVVFDGDYHRAGAIVWGSGLLEHARTAGHSFEQAHLFYVASLEGEMGHMCAATCTTGVARVVRWAGDPELQRRFLEPLTERDAGKAMRGAQYLTEVQGGSDVGANVVAAREATDGLWRLTGEKWFCSVADADVFLVMARPDGSSTGTNGLGVFLVPRLVDGAPNGFSIRRLKDKLGTTSMASGEIDFADSLAYPVGDPHRGFGLMVGGMLNASRWLNAVGNVGIMRRSYLEASAYAVHRRAFGQPIAGFPAVRSLLANVKTEWLAALHSTWALTALDALADRHGSGEPGIDEDDLRFHRFLVNANKLVTSQACTAAVRDAIEVLGGNGAIESFSVLPRLLRDSVVYEQWEGTHNVLTAQVGRDMGKLDLLPVVVDRISVLLRDQDGTARIRAALQTAEADASRAIRDTSFAAWHFRGVLTRLVRTYQAALLTAAAAAAGPELGDELRAAAEVLIAAHADPGYRPEDDPAFAGRIGAVLGEDV